MNRDRGFTLIELLVSIALFGLLLGLTYRALADVTGINADQTAAARVQGKLRLASEVIAQELRQGVFGAVIDTPVASGNDAFSIALIDGVSGYAVAEPPRNFRRRKGVDVVVPVARAAQTGFRRGDRALLVNASGDALLFTVTGVRAVESGRWTVKHRDCTNGMDYTPGTLLFRVRALGVAPGARLDARLDPDTLYLVYEDRLEPLAFDVDRFEVHYVYRDAAGGEVTDPTTAAGYSDDYPAPVLTSSSGRSYTLARLSLRLSAADRARGREVRRTLVEGVELANNGTYRIRRLQVCGE